MTDPVILVDGSSYLFRAFYALPHLKSPQGEPSGAILGVMNMLKRLLKDHDPQHIGIIFDPKGKNFRHDIYPEYKANRSAMPEDLSCQIQATFNMIELMGLPLIIVDGVEADDVIGSLSKQLVAQNRTVLISSSDKDLAQLIEPGVSIIDTMKDVHIDTALVEQKYGVRPDQIIDLLALAGDTSDNIPGIPSVGMKTAAKWLQQYDSLENLLAHSSEIKGKVGEKLRDNEDLAHLSKRLTTIKCDVDIKIDLSQLQRQATDHTPFIDALKKWGFSSWLKEYSHEEIQAQSTEDTAQYECILTGKQLDRYLDKIKQQQSCALDTETTSLDSQSAKLVGISLAVAQGHACYIPLAHDYLGAPAQLEQNMVLSKLKTILEDPAIAVIGQNIKYDYHILSRYGIEIANVAFDTMLASFVLYSGQGRHGLDYQALKFFNHSCISYESLTGSGAKQIPFSQVDVHQACTYASEDADYTWRLYQHHKAEFAKEPGLLEVFKHIEMPLVKILVNMEQTGVLLDRPQLALQAEQLSTKLQALEQKVHALAGEPFNLGSPKQLQHILYERMDIKVIKKTPGGQPSTSEEVLMTLAPDYPIVEHILIYRHLSKLLSTYLLPLPQQADAQGRIHTTYLQSGAATGRFSSAKPNLQNIPIKTKEGRAIRSAFIAPKDHLLVAADYSQVELRIMAHLSNDPGLLKAFKNNVDVHQSTASDVFDVPLDAVTDAQRRAAKAINFGLMYGMSAFGLAKQLQCDRAQAAQYIESYFARYPKVKDFMHQSEQQAIEHGYVETLAKRRLYLPDIHAKNGLKRQAAQRAAINAPLQGSAADIIKRAMIQVHQTLQEGQYRATMLMQVHDELVFEVHQEDVAAFKIFIAKAMQDAAALSVPLLVDVGSGYNWQEAH